MTPEEKRLAIANKLLERTDRGAVKWEEAAEEKKFLTSFSQYSVAIRKTLSLGWGPDQYTISLIDAAGKLLEEVSEKESSSAVLTTLYQKARREALGVEKALDDVLGSLE